MDFNPIVTNNPNIEVIDWFNAKCVACGGTIELDAYKFSCPHCNTRLFGKMRKSGFTNLFRTCLSVINVPEKDINRFMSDSKCELKDIGICTELSILIDLNFQTKFGGQYKSFFIKDSFETILINNFDNEENGD
jgi:DNA-directed RNA polymerase subunit RPC12/RpoP